MKKKNGERIINSFYAGRNDIMCSPGYGRRCRNTGKRSYR